jgi:UDP-N-acetylmuramate dehydrogenase
MADTQQIQKAYGYMRVSTTEQVENMSFHTQEQAIRDYANRNNIELVHIYHDDGYTAKHARRPDLQEMLSKLSDRHCDIKNVIIYSTNRLTRDMSSFSQDIGSILSAHKVKLHSSTEQIDETPQGRFMRSLSIALGQLDNEQKGQTIADNMRGVALDGWWQGNIPLGYSAKKVPIGQSRGGKVKERLTLERSEDTGDKVQALLERFSKGDITQAELAQYADGIGLKSSTGGTLGLQSIKNMLTSITYAGFISNKCTDYEPTKGRHDALISKDTFYHNQAILEGRKPDDIAPRFTTDYPLKHALLCVSCGKSLTGSAPTSGSGKPSPRYSCARCKGMGSITTKRAHKLWETFLNDITPTEKMIDLFRIIVRRVANEKLTDIGKQLADLRSQQTKIDDDMRKATQEYLDCNITKDNMVDYQSSLRLKRIDLGLAIDELTDIQRLNEDMINYVCNYMNTPAKMWQDSDTLTKIEFQKMITVSGLVFDIKNEKFRTDSLTLFYRLKDNQKDSEEPSESNMVHPAGLEPATLCSEDRCSNPLSYGCTSEVIIPLNRFMSYNYLTMEIHTNIPLKNYTTMKIGGPARFMTEVRTPDEVAEICRNAKKQNLPIFILGSGSNVIAKDTEYSGIVVRMRIPGFEVIADDINATTIKIGAGEDWDSIVGRAVEMGLSGIESMSAIPGTAGAAPVQNVGAYGQEIADTLQSLEAYDQQTGRFVTLGHNECEFAYRDSIFRNKSKGRYVITSITIKLSKNQPTPPFYDALQKYLDNHKVKIYTVESIRNAVIEIRKTKLPDPKTMPNSGSFFKHAIIEDWQLGDLRKKYPEMPIFELGDGKYKIPTGWLIEKVGLKGSLIHGMRVYDQNALVLVNETGASYDDLVAAREEIAGKIRDAFRIQIMQEPLEI